jgi:hypothetical protein
MIINKNNKQTKNQESKQANHYEQAIKIKILQTCVSKVGTIFIISKCDRHIKTWIRTRKKPLKTN